MAANKPIQIRISRRKVLVLERTCPHLDECKRLIAEMIKQAVRDLYNFEEAVLPAERELYNTAVDFIFDDECFVDWGGKERCLRDFLDILDLQIDWFREQVLLGRRTKKQTSQKEIDEAILPEL